MIFPPSLIPRRVLLCLSREEKGLPVKALFARYNIEVLIATNIRSAIEQMKKSLPHAVLSETIFHDDTVATIFNFVRNDPLMSKVPVFINLQSKSRTELEPCKGQDIAGYFMGRFDPKVFLKSIFVHDSKVGFSSPYFYPLVNTVKGTQTIKLTGLGKTHDAVILSSHHQLSNHAEFKCMFPGGHQATLAGNVTVHSNRGSYYHIFPFSKISGPGRIEFMKLPNLPVKSNTSKRLLVLTQCDRAYFDSLSKVLSGYDIESIYSESLQDAANAALSEIDRDPICISFNTQTEQVDAWNKRLEKIQEEDRPALVLVTSDWNSIDMQDIRYLRTPFSIGQFLSVVDSLGIRAHVLDELGEEHANLPLRLSCSFKLIGVDESGGVYSSKMPQKVGEKIQLDQSILSKVNPAKEEMIITACAAIPEEVGRWYIHFRLSNESQSKYDHLDCLMDELEEELRKEDPPVTVDSKVS